MPRHLVDQNHEHRDCGPDQQVGDDGIEDDGSHLEDSTTEPFRGGVGPQTAPTLVDSRHAADDRELLEYPSSSATLHPMRLAETSLTEFKLVLHSRTMF
jgi:hypothetical protein